MQSEGVPHAGGRPSQGYISPARELSGRARRPADRRARIPTLPIASAGCHARGQVPRTLLVRTWRQEGGRGPLDREGALWAVEALEGDRAVDRVLVRPALCRRLRLCLRRPAGRRECQGEVQRVRNDHPGAVEDVRRRELAVAVDDDLIGRPIAVQLELGGVLGVGGVRRRRRGEGRDRQRADTEQREASLHRVLLLPPTQRAPQITPDASRLPKATRLSSPATRSHYRPRGAEERTCSRFLNACQAQSRSRPGPYLPSSAKTPPISGLSATSSGRSAARISGRWPRRPARALPGSPPPCARESG